MWVFRWSLGANGLSAFLSNAANVYLLTTNVAKHEHRASLIAGKMAGSCASPKGKSLTFLEP